jgi:hypothetical protein
LHGARVLKRRIKDRAGTAQAMARHDFSPVGAIITQVTGLHEVFLAEVNADGRC